MAPKRPDETWHRLRDWTHGSTLAERLAAQILFASDYTDLDPSHPLGGPDGGKDGIANRDGKKWVMAVYFPLDRVSFKQLRTKFLGDVKGVSNNSADGIAFVTNQALSLSQRDELEALAPSGCLVDLYHLERCQTILDRPVMGTVRRQFYLEDENEADRIIGAQTGGDPIGQFMLYHFDMTRAVAQQVVFIKHGAHPLYDVSMRIVDMDAGTGTNLYQQKWENIVGPAEYYATPVELPDSLYWRIFFIARNGQWRQDLILNRSDIDGCWLAATIVFGLQNSPQITHIDAEFTKRSGAPTWRP